MIEEFNPVLLQSKNMYEAWLNICCDFAKKNNVDLRKWIAEKPDFTFSKKKVEEEKKKISTNKTSPSPLCGEGDVTMEKFSMYWG